MDLSSFVSIEINNADIKKIDEQCQVLFDEMKKLMDRYDVPQAQRDNFQNRVDNFEENVINQYNGNVRHQARSISPTPLKRGILMAYCRELEEVFRTTELDCVHFSKDDFGNSKSKDKSLGFDIDDNFNLNITVREMGKTVEKDFSPYTLNDLFDELVVDAIQLYAAEITQNGEVRSKEAIAEDIKSKAYGKDLYEFINCYDKFQESVGLYEEWSIRGKVPTLDAILTGEASTKGKAQAVERD